MKKVTNPRKNTKTKKQLIHTADPQLIIVYKHHTVTPEHYKAQAWCKPGVQNLVQNQCIRRASTLLCMLQAGAAGQ